MRMKDGESVVGFVVECKSVTQVFTTDRKCLHYRQEVRRCKGDCVLQSAEGGRAAF